MKRILSILLLSTLLFACTPEGRIYEKHKELSPDVEWLKEDTRSFQVPIEDTSIPYDFSVAFRYATGYPYQVAKVRVSETSPSGEVSIHDYDLKIREDDGEYIGEPGYDIWDSTHLVEANKTYTESGTYAYVIEHTMPEEKLIYAMEIGLILDKAQ